VVAIFNHRSFLFFEIRFFVFFCALLYNPAVPDFALGFLFLSSSIGVDVMRLVAMFVALTWSVVGSVSMGQEVQADQSRVKGGNVVAAKMRALEEWNSDTKLYIDKTYKVNKKDYPATKGEPKHTFINGIDMMGQIRFEVVKLIDETTTLLKFKDGQCLLVEYENKKLNPKEIVRLVPAVQVIESIEHEGKPLPALRLTTLKAYKKYVDDYNKEKRR